VWLVLGSIRSDDDFLFKFSFPRFDTGNKESLRFRSSDKQTVITNEGEL
jgi:hypothetical protein